MKNEKNYNLKIFLIWICILIIIWFIMSALIYSSYFKTVEECGAVKDSLESDHCYKIYAEKNLDPFICENIESEYIMAACISDVAIRKNDIELCKQVTIYYHRDSCYFNIAVSSNNPKLCENIVQESPDYIYDYVTTNTKDACYFNIAINSKDSVLCNKLKKNTKERCFRQIEE